MKYSMSVNMRRHVNLKNGVRPAKPSVYRGYYLVCLERIDDNRARIMTKLLLVWYP